MHAYATDSDERKIVHGSLALAGVVLALVLNWILQTAKTSIPWWIDAPSVIGFYGFLYWAFDKFLWKGIILCRIGLIKIPDLSGTWEGHICSSHDSHTEKYEAELIIQQTWTKISVSMRTERSQSYSNVGALFTVPKAELRYQYSSEPRSGTKDSMHIHRGTAWLALHDEKLEGEYYTGRDRQNHGTLAFQRKA